MWFCGKKQRFKWEEKFEPLAVYNSECGRGIVHTEEYDNKMKVLQDEYNDKIRGGVK